MKRHNSQLRKNHHEWKTGRTSSNYVKKWGIKEGGKRECGGQQDADYPDACPLPTIKRRKEDFVTTGKRSDKATHIAAYWGGGRVYEDRHDQ
ncbi:Hypothetical protein CINCED_3A002887 [Cinara cedri]|uniref:Uncharacterized protein n=1 Tax=Cinara cedri TaxID=506608 RepID=A0A5E4N8R6_9HEMI|nr:Hypothetical protein CINCED_3A002887 [Cinara cedri]